MKKLVLGICALAVIGYLGTAGYVYYFDKERSTKVSTHIKLDSADVEIQQMFYEKGCDYCHTPNAELPFYASLPIAKQIMDYDVKQGYLHFNMKAVMDSFQNEKAVSEVDLAKIERVMLNKEMPPTRYVALHWLGSMSETETAKILEWVQRQRVKYYASADVSEKFKGESLRPLPLKLETNAEKVELGRILYHDTRLSGDDTISCATCHDLKAGGVDGLVTSKGIHGQLGPINAPTVYNAAFNMAQFWDGRAADLQEQAGGPPLNPLEMGAESWDQIVGKLKADEDIVQRFAAVYPQGDITEKTITDAIAEFEKTMITPNAPFDRYLRGDEKAMTEQQIRGYALFKQNRCDTCHVGENIGGQSYEYMGQKKNYFERRNQQNNTGLTDADNGRWGVTKNERDRYRFKTPTLRNIELTGPYFHDGSAKTVIDAVKIMAEYQVGNVLSDKDAEDITAFLRALNGEIPAPYAQK